MNSKIKRLVLTNVFAFVQDPQTESVNALERYVESAMATDYFETFWETATDT